MIMHPLQSIRIRAETATFRYGQKARPGISGQCSPPAAVEGIIEHRIETPQFLFGPEQTDGLGFVEAEGDEVGGVDLYCQFDHCLLVCLGLVVRHYVRCSIPAAISLAANARLSGV